MENLFFGWSGRPRLRSRRPRRDRCYELEGLETRTALAVGPQAVRALDGPAAPLIDSSTLLLSPEVVKVVEGVWTAYKTGDVSSATIGELGVNQGTASIRLLAEAFSSLVPADSDLVAGLAGAMAVFGQEYRNGVPIASLLDNSASVIGSAPGEIPPQAVALGVSAAIAAQKAGFGMSTSVPYLSNVAADETQLGAWIASAVGRLDARSEGGGSTPTSSTPPSFLIPLGDFVLSNLVSIYANAFQYNRTLSGSAEGSSSLVSSRPIATAEGNGLSYGASASYPATGGSGRALLQGVVSLREEFRVAYGTPGITSDPLVDYRGIHGSSEEFAYPDADVQDVERYIDLEGSALFEDRVGAASPAAVTTGNLPLEILLGEPVFPAEEDSSAIEEMAELILSDNSWFAVVATLWTVHSESRSESVEDGVASEARADREMALALPPSVSFILGVDEVLESSRLEAVRAIEGLRGEDGSSAFYDERQAGRCPMIPSGIASEKPGRTHEGGRSPEWSSKRTHQVEITAEEAPISLPGPLWAFVVPVAAVIVGWSWARRSRRRKILNAFARMLTSSLPGRDCFVDDLSFTLRTRPRGGRSPS